MVTDVSSINRLLSREWRRTGFNGFAYDVKLDSQHDILSRKGFFILLDHLLQLLVLQQVVPHLGRTNWSIS